MNCSTTGQKYYGSPDGTWAVSGKSSGEDRDRRLSNHRAARNHALNRCSTRWKRST